MTKVEIRRIESLDNIEMISSVAYEVSVCGYTLKIPNADALADLRDMLDAYISREEIQSEIELEMEEGAA